MFHHHPLNYVVCWTRTEVTCGFK